MLDYRLEALLGDKQVPSFRSLFVGGLAADKTKAILRAYQPYEYQPSYTDDGLVMHGIAMKGPALGFSANVPGMSFWSEDCVLNRAALRGWGDEANCDDKGKPVIKMEVIDVDEQQEKNIPFFDLSGFMNDKSPNDSKVGNQVADGFHRVFTSDQFRGYDRKETYVILEQGESLYQVHANRLKFILVHADKSLKLMNDESYNLHMQTVDFCDSTDIFDRYKFLLGYEFSDRNLRNSTGFIYFTIGTKVNPYEQPFAMLEMQRSSSKIIKLFPFLLN